jgi:SAM-dependent methyltransferase
MSAIDPREKSSISAVERQMKAFYNQSSAYSDLLSSQEFRRDLALDNYVSLVSRHRSPHGILLDLGCGKGETTGRLAARGRYVVGLDISALLLSQPQPLDGQHRPNFVIGDIVRLPFRSHSVSCVSLHNVIEHVPDTDGLLREIVRVLRDDGQVIIVSPNLLSPVRPLRHLLGIEGFNTRFYGSGWGAVAAIVSNIYLLMTKLSARQPAFTHRTPLLGDDFQCPDDDAVYMANVVDLRKWFEASGFTAVYTQFLPQRRRFSDRLKSQVLGWLPWLDKGFCLIAQRNTRS